MKGVIRFGKKEKLSPRYIGPYVVLRRIGKAVYEMDLPFIMISIHTVFHVSMLRRYIPNLSHVLRWDSVLLD